ncbi:MAG: PilZ domain-containing protein [Pseudobdellovibrionaceae bacterium]|uniref:PilZ domain-containing protein n=1 Tax=Oligoflexus sp. TaxID=1971216 RepID=UPI0027C59FEB|nr:PilZ domain-containing protein [Oligoflexus sp.]MDQ3233138.1 PilZ domain-containing protein [Pseudobdellovibrionaceae bacterium]HYX39321.1 PilZ domain-containing protein [Oligoflexus sp.]
MSETTDKKKPDTIEDKTAAKIEAYLQGPRKKRKNYVIFALGDRFDKDLSFAMEGFIKKEYAQLAISTPRTPDELTRQFGRNISLLVMNDEFTEKTAVMNLIRALKEKRRNETIPVLFLTRDAEELVKIYHKELLLYHESDEYIVYPGNARQQIMARIKAGIDNQNHRRSRRYNVSLSATVFHLNKNTVLEGKIVDLSMHGALINAEKDVIFRPGDQIKISIPIHEYIQYEYGDFIKISAKVRRVFISGNKVAISFEHVTDSQSHLIGQLLLAIVSKQFARQTARLKAQYAAQSGEKRR